MEFLEVVILATAVVSVLLSWASTRTASPAIAILSRWVRWGFIAILFGGSIHLFNWTGYPLWVLVCVSFLVWFMIETAYNWLAIHALSKSELPLFPRFVENNRGDEWPSQPRFIKLKDWLRRHQFQKMQALVALVGDQVIMRMSSYENADKTIRLNILFLPQVRGGSTECIALHSQTAGGKRLITDNIFLPFGGFYPEAWSLERKPLVRSVQRLYDRHFARMDAEDDACIPFPDTPLAQINDDQFQLEKLNRELGFLNKRTQETEDGRLTPAARARIWQEIWTLSYLGKPLKY